MRRRGSETMSVSRPLYDPPSSECLEKLLRSVGPWYTVGLKLGVPTDQMDDIASEWARPQDQRREMFGIWLQRFTEGVSWVEVAGVLEKQGFSKPAEEIRKRYVPGVQQQCDQTSRPTIKQLQSLQHSGETIKVIEGAASSWKSLGYQLDFSTAVLENINCDGRTVEERCLMLFERWLDIKNTPDPQKVTWERLCRALENIELSVLAANLRKALSEKL